MRRSKRSVALALLAATSLTAGLSACSGGAATQPSGDSSADKTINVLDYWQDDPGKTAFNNFLTKCSETTGYTFKRLTVPQDTLITKASQLTASGDGPGMIVSDNNQVATLADAGVLAPFDISVTGLKAEDFVAGPYSSANYQGQQYGLPVGNNGEVIVYNKKMLADAGVKPPKTWSELTAAAKKLTHGGVTGWGVTLKAGETGAWNFVSQLWSNGAKLDKLDSPEAIEAADWYTSFVRQGTAPHASLNWDSTELEAQFADGKIAMVQIGSWMLPQLNKDAKAKHLEFGQTQQVAPDGKPLVTPFGGEDFTVGVGADGDAAAAAARCIASWSDQETVMKNSATMGYVPAYKPAIEPFVQAHPEVKTLSEQLQNSRARTEEVGAAYPAVSTALSTALQQIAIGKKSPAEAMADAQSAAQR
jgi:multiple sugar transport system substrate-binding protein